MTLNFNISDEYICGEKFRQAANNIPNVIYADQDDVNSVIRNIAKSDKKWVLVSHNGDFPSDYDLPDNVIRWYGQNMRRHGEKYVGIPIGISNPCWGEIGRIDQLEDCRKNNYIDNYLYFSCKIYTNEEKRKKAFNYIQDKFLTHKQITTRMGNGYVPRQEYLNNIRRSIFTLSPPGNGADCCRTWETLYLERTPICEYSPEMEHFKDLPILFYKNIEEIDESFFNVKKPIEMNLDKLKISYWIDRIKKDAESIL